MASPSDIISVEILGTKLQLRGGNNPEAVQEACLYVKERVEDLAKKAPTAPSLQIVLLTAINIADERLQLDRDQEWVDEAMIKAGKILAKAGEAEIT